MDALGEYASAELEIKRSRFLAEVFPVSTQGQARSLLKAQKERHEDATHVVHGFVLGPAAEVLGMSDDGEPAGTAGRPVLDVLKGRGCTNILLTVTRWFGGILLGTGGLVKAYGDSAKAVLSVARFHQLVARRSFRFSVDYEQYQQIKRYLADHIREIVSLDKLAKAMDKSPNYLNSVFLKATGVSIHRYMNREKMKLVSALMEDRGLTFREACENVGITELSHGYRLFKRHMGVTPKEYLSAEHLE